MEFQIGDRVVCIDSSSKSNLILNEEYVVIGKYDEFINLADNNGNEKQGFYPRRFMLAKTYYRKEKLKKLRK